MGWVTSLGVGSFQVLALNAAVYIEQNYYSNIVLCYQACAVRASNTLALQLCLVLLPSYKTKHSLGTTVANNL